MSIKKAIKSIIQAGSPSEVRCSRCGRPITNPEYISKGMGPSCYAKSKKKKVFKLL